jgi:hypothetical protein
MSRICYAFAGRRRLWESKTLACILLLIGVCGTSRDARAQRISVLDFTATVPKARKRVPKPFPPGMKLGGVAAGILGEATLIVSMVSLDREAYSMGDEIVYTLDVRNVSAEPIKIPTRFNLADLEPDDPSADFQYAPMEIWLGLRESEERNMGVLLLTLYGSDDMPWTQLEIKPGEWVEIRSKAKLEAADRTKQVFHSAYGIHSSVPLPQGEVKASVGFWKGDYLYFEGRTQYEYVGGGIHQMWSSPYNGRFTIAPTP